MLDVKLQTVHSHKKLQLRGKLTTITVSLMNTNQTGSTNFQQVHHEHTFLIRKTLAKTKGKTLHCLLFWKSILSLSPPSFKHQDNLFENLFMQILTVQSCKLYNNKHIITLTQIKNTHSQLFQFLRYSAVKFCL